MQSVHTLLKLAQLRWTGHVTRMPDERLPKKFSLENCRKESTHKVAKRNATKTHSLKGSVKKGKQEPRDHHQTRHSPNSHALFATDSLELQLAYTAINEHT